MGNYYEQTIAANGSFFGRVLVQARGSIGGHRHVFVKLQGSKNGLVFPTSGGILKNPFKGFAKGYAGDLVEYKPSGTDEGATVKLLKTYLVASDVTSTGTSVMIVRDGYKHIPFVGDILMKAPDTLTGTGDAATVTAVEKTTDSGVDVWKLTLSGAIGALAKDDVLVEASEAGEDVTAMVTNPNCFLPCDYDFLYDPTTSDDDFDGARYLLTPCLANEDTKTYINRMSPLPPAIKALNKSRVEGWFNL